MGMAPVIRVVERLLAPLRRRVMLMIGRGVVRLVDDTRRRQRVQVEGFAGEILDDVERWQQYGITSHPPVGSEAVVLALGGMRQHPAAVVVEDAPYRLESQTEGTVSLYTWRDRGVPRQRIVLGGGEEREIRIESRREDRAGAMIRMSSASPAIIEAWVDEPGRRPRETSLEMTATSIVLARGRSRIEMSDSEIVIRSPHVRYERAA